MLNSQLRNIILRGAIVSIEKMEIDIVILYKLLNIIYETPGISLTELFNEYRKREGVKVNYNKVKKHIEYAELKGLVSVKKGKPAKMEITRKGVDFLFLMNRVLSGVLGEQI